MISYPLLKRKPSVVINDLSKVNKIRGVVSKLVNQLVLHKERKYQKHYYWVQRLSVKILQNRSLHLSSYGQTLVILIQDKKVFLQEAVVFLLKGQNCYLSWHEKGVPHHQPNRHENDVDITQLQRLVWSFVTEELWVRYSVVFIKLKVFWDGNIFGTNDQISWIWNCLQ